MADITKDTITVDVVTHKDTGLMIATSEEMRGLYVHGRSIAEINERLLVAIRAMLEADGKVVESITPIDDDTEAGSGFQASRKRYQLSEAA